MVENEKFSERPLTKSFEAVEKKFGWTKQQVEFACLLLQKDYPSPELMIEDIGSIFRQKNPVFYIFKVVCLLVRIYIFGGNKMI
ncbi:hypothetical protein G4B88_017226 [Cannabis sativa]|uniref:Uncharacterized protein n=1 Tax=Cannabis sativa TaxID=3483 RepID=A0A7J6G334_CANSA|nr:hypothetical protein G4B88_017226 [Cannabis sativa]